MKSHLELQTGHIILAELVEHLQGVRIDEADRFDSDFVELLQLAGFAIEDLVLVLDVELAPEPVGNVGLAAVGLLQGVRALAAPAVDGELARAEKLLDLVILAIA